MRSTHLWHCVYKRMIRVVHRAFNNLLCSSNCVHLASVIRFSFSLRQSHYNLHHLGHFFPMFARSLIKISRSSWWSSLFSQHVLLFLSPWSFPLILSNIDDVQANLEFWPYRYLKNLIIVCLLLLLLVMPRKTRDISHSFPISLAKLRKYALLPLGFNGHMVAYHCPFH